MNIFLCEASKLKGTPTTWFNPKVLWFFKSKERTLSESLGHHLHENQQRFVWRKDRKKTLWNRRDWPMRWHQRTVNCQEPSHCALGGSVCAPTTQAALCIRRESLKRGAASWAYLFSETALLGLLGLPLSSSQPQGATKHPWQNNMFGCREGRERAKSLEKLRFQELSV